MRTVAVQDIEKLRLEAQARLDSLKTASERNKLGQFATPPELALSIARYVRKLMGDTPVRFLDPAVGTGSFYSALSQVFSSEEITAWDASGTAEIPSALFGIAHRLRPTMFILCCTLQANCAKC